MWFIVVFLLFPLWGTSAAYRDGKMPLLMPKVRPMTNDAYLCTPIKVDNRKSYFITAFEPQANMRFVHHMLVYGCTSPGANKTSHWDCKEMAQSTPGERLLSPCSEGSQIIYAWAMDAPQLVLPEGVGFKVGGETPIQYIVLQVHYSDVSPFKDGSRDSSGVLLHFSERPLDKLAGVLRLRTTGGMIMPHSTENMEAACEIKEDITIFPFAYRTHTHALGTVVSGYRVRPKFGGGSDWQLLGKRSPQTPQMFYPTETLEPIQPGDAVASRCTMVNNGSEVVKAGPTKKDEMCVFFLMYYVISGEPLKTKNCFTSGPPQYYWNRTNFLHNIPDKEASQLPTSLD